MRRRAVLLVAVGALSACGTDDPGRSSARAACPAYAGTGRHQCASTAEQADAVRATARRDATRAAAAAATWAPLRP